MDISKLSKTSIFKFKDPRQERIFQKLSLIGQGPVSFFHDACVIMSDSKDLDAASHIVAHLLREIEASVRNVLIPIDFVKPEKGGHKAEVQQIIKTYSLEPQEGADFWLKLSDQDQPGGLASRAHRNALFSPRKIDSDFSSLWENMQLLLDTLLGKIEISYAGYFPQLDLLIKKQNITKADIKNLQEKVPNNNVTLRYFFDKIDNPLWLSLLYKAGYFNYPPEPLIHLDKGISYPSWEVIPYLLKTVSTTSSQTLIVSIIENTNTENSRVKAELIEVAVKLTPSLLQKLVPKLLSWINESNFDPFFLPERYGNLISVLAKAKKTKEAFEIAQSILRPVQEKKAPVKINETSETYDFPAEATALFDDWEYEQILTKNIPDLFEKDPMRTITTLCDLLDKTISIRDRSKSDEDYSYIWQSAIENHSQNLKHGIKSLLVNAVRDNCEKYCVENPSKIDDLISDLEKRKWNIFHRIAFHLTRLFFEKVSMSGKQKILALSNFDKSYLKHEYYLLLRECFSKLSISDQEELLRLIDSGPDIEEYKKRYKKELKKEATQEAIDTHISYWKRDRFSAIEKDLPKKFQKTYADLLKKIGQADSPDLAFFSKAGSFGPTSPKSLDDLSAMNPKKLVAFLKKWIPAEGAFDNSKEGLSRVLTELVKKNPEDFTKNIELFLGIEPTYARGILNGFKELINQASVVDWTAVIRLCQWVMEQPRQYKTEVRPSIPFGEDPDWSWSFNTVAELLSAGFKQTKGIPIALRKAVWDILEKLSKDSDPTPEQETKYKNDYDPVSLSINSTRGDAMHAVMRYGLWVKQNSGKEKEKTTLKQMPELKLVLEEHLDIKKDPSYAIRSVYGQWLGTLTYIDKQWVKANLEKILPEQVDLEGYWISAWDGYISFVNPNDKIFEILKEKYTFAISKIGETKKIKHHPFSMDERLVEHIMAMYWSDFFKLDDPLMNAFWGKSTDALRDHAIDFIGKSLHDTPDDLDVEIARRLKELWEYRIKILKEKGDRVDEPNGFGWWFIAKKLPEDWLITQLLEALKASKRIEPDHLVAEKLVETAQSNPLETVNASELLALNENIEWGIIHIRDELINILKIVLESGNQTAVNKAKELINKLVARGYTDFKELLPN